MQLCGDYRKAPLFALHDNVVFLGKIRRLVANVLMRDAYVAPFDG